MTVRSDLNDCYDGFADCLSLKTVIFEEGVTKVPDRMFDGCLKVEGSTVSLPSTLTSIGYGAFSNCNGLTEIELPDGLTSIGERAFSNCFGLTKVFYHGSRNDWGYISIESGNYEVTNQAIVYPITPQCGDNLIWNLDENGTLSFVGTGDMWSFGPPSTASASEWCAPWYLRGDEIKRIEIPYTMRSIDYYLFSNCSQLESVVVPFSITMAADAFSESSDLTILGYQYADGQKYADANGYAFEHLDIPPTEVEIDQDQMTLWTGDTVSIEAIIEPFVMTEEIVWRSSNKSVASVDQKGMITALSSGTTNIKLSVGSFTRTCTVTVKQKATNIDLNAYFKSLEAGSTFQLTATISPSNVDETEVIWTSSNPTVATVDQNGLVRALSNGTVSIVAEAKDGQGASSACEVSVSGTYVDSTAGFESIHNYENNTDELWVYIQDGADSVRITFDSRTEVEKDYDYIYILDKNNDEIGKYTGTALAGQTVTVPGNVVKVRLVSDDAGAKWGFKITAIHSNPFTDVSENRWFYAPVMWAYSTGVTTGATATTFEPNKTCTRAEFVAFLYKYMGMPWNEAWASECNFSDVKETNWFYRAVIWANHVGVTHGTTSTTFSPNVTLDRAMVISFLYNMEKYQHGTPKVTLTSTRFTDVPKRSYYYDPVLWAEQYQITNGSTPTTFAPADNCTRAEAVAFLYNIDKYWKK